MNGNRAFSHSQPEWQRAIIGCRAPPGGPLGFDPCKTYSRTLFDPFHLRLGFHNMPPLPVELIEMIIDIVAQCSPESLISCALISRRWTPRSTHHVNRIFRKPVVSTFDEPQALLAIVRGHPHLASLATSLEVVPVAELNSMHASYVPFHHLASHVLPNARRLILGETLRWSDYPLLYNNGTVGFCFHSVVTLDISCHFNSIGDLFSAIQSFRNIQDVRLVYPRHIPPQWMFPDQMHNIPLSPKPFCRKTFKLQNLQLSVSGRPIIGEECLLPTQSQFPFRSSRSPHPSYVYSATPLPVCRLHVPKCPLYRVGGGLPTDLPYQD